MTKKYKEFNMFDYVVRDGEPELAAEAQPYARNSRVDWHLLIGQYAELKVGQGLLSHQMIDMPRARIIPVFKARGLEVDVDYKLTPAYVDAHGQRLPKGNWLQYITRLTREEPSLPR